MSLRGVNSILDRLAEGWSFIVSEKDGSVDYMLETDPAGYIILPFTQGDYVFKNVNLIEVEKKVGFNGGNWTIYKERRGPSNEYN